MVLAAIAALSATFPAAASAGSYRVYSCVAPSDRPAPIADGSYSWQASGRPQAGSVFLTNECAARRGIAARLDGTSAQPLAAGGQVDLHAGTQHLDRRLRPDVERHGGGRASRRSAAPIRPTRPTSAATAPISARSAWWRTTST
jgi:hypothetical protein